ncbi:MAG: hypothetical protein A2017_07195 [Lentisphaerae bacterium GWF2_44_16]|nr:MAG: hypothetical protein A2017_07195 [Lentisphaerae bacterium GWF2_44_16]
MRELFNELKPLFFDRIKFPSSLKLLVLAPHPDDFDAIGVTMKYFRDNGNQIFLAVISGAASGVEDSFMATHPGKSKAEIREEEQKSSSLFFGLPEKNISFLRLSEDAEGHPEESPANMEKLKTHLMEISPDMVFMPHGNDTNPGHNRTYSMFKKIAPSLNKPITVFLNRDPKTIEMRNDVFTVFGKEEAEWKAELLRLHISQHQRNLNTRNHGFDERVLKVNSEIALKYLKLQNAYAEVFEIEHFN